jgi:hypothetical protein
VDAFEIGVLVAVATAVVACCLAARASAGRRLGELGGRRGPGSPAASELARRDEEDLQEMLEATNARRRARGQPERTLADAIREFGDE